jgi:hypothetical protein
MDPGTRTCMRLEMRLTAVMSPVAGDRSRRPDLPPLGRGSNQGYRAPPEDEGRDRQDSSRVDERTAAAHARFRALDLACRTAPDVNGHRSPEYLFGNCWAMISLRLWSLSEARLRYVFTGRSDTLNSQFRDAYLR